MLSDKEKRRQRIELIERSFDRHKNQQENPIEKTHKGWIIHGTSVDEKIAISKGGYIVSYETKFKFIGLPNNNVENVNYLAKLHFAESRKRGKARTFRCLSSYYNKYATRVDELLDTYSFSKLRG